MDIFLKHYTLIRLSNCLIASLAVAVGQYLVSIPGYFKISYIPAMAAFFVCGYGNIINDIVDRKSDEINHPDRPIPAGQISIGSARALAILFLAVCGILAIFLNLVGILIVFSGIILVTWYDFRLKHTPYWGNAVVSLLGGMTFILGGVAVRPDNINTNPGVLAAAGFAFIAHFGREIIKDIQDRIGDSAAGSRTGAISGGPLQAMIIVYILFGLLTVMTIVVYKLEWFNKTFLYITILGVISPALIQFIWLGKSLDGRKLGLVSLFMKLEMLPGVLALILGRQY
ncbi:MAG: geranylgeranylglycerol-phosphate geranylgeranyltransferase [Candidatus Zixiibacteriota bacterium]